VEDPSFKKYIPAGEVQHSARWRDLLDAGVFLIGNTDDPWCCTDWRNGFKGSTFEASAAQAIYQGVTRSTFVGKQPEAWQVAQAVTVPEALEMLTLHGAYAAHQENVIGSLKVGKYADIVVLSENPLTIPIEQIPNIKIVMTMVGGDVKYCTAGYETVCMPERYP
jgi:predicted amidohydrolase YtcJ